MVDVWNWRSSPKNVWGPAGWQWLHDLARRYPVHAVHEDRELAHTRIYNFLSSLECPECKFHALEYFAKKPPNLSGRSALVYWTWEFHNDVNKRLGKKLFPYSAVQW